MASNKIFLALIAIFLLFLVGCTFLENKESFKLPSPSSSPFSIDKNTTDFKNFSFSNQSDSEEIPKLKKFSNYQEMKAWLDRASSIESSTAPSREAIPLLGSAPTLSKTAGVDYSKTNIQVEGIDEPDIIKTTQNHLFIIKNNKLFIFEITPKPKKLFEKKLIEDNDDFLSSIFVEDNYLVVFIKKYKKTYKIDEFDFQPMEYYEPYTLVQIYNIEDKSNPKLLQELKFFGSFTDARLKDKKVYLISSQEARSKPYPTPWYFDKELIYSPVYYIDSPPSTSYYKLNQISIFSLDGKVLDSKAFLLNGDQDTVYMSENNIYIAASQFPPIFCRWWWCPTLSYQINKTERFEKAILPHLPLKIRQQIAPILAKNISDSEKWIEIEPILLNYIRQFEDSSKVSKSQFEEFQSTIEKIQEAVAEYDANIKIKHQKTIIYKFSFEGDKLKLKASAFVNGYLINQWALDEYQENLRVATTIDVWAKKNVVYNSVYVLDKELKLVSLLDKLAPDEKIYGVRFMGPKVFLITYKKIDPLFVIDLSNPKVPKVLGYLKIPGYYTYLHPYDDNTLIAIGQLTSFTEYDIERIDGLKVGLIDISEPEKPKLLDEFLEGDSGTTSPVLYNHKAFVYDQNRKLLYLPITVVKKSKSLFYDKLNYFYGVYALNLSNKKINLVGKIEHYSKSSDFFDYLGQDYSVERVAYFSTIIASVSNKYVLFNELDKKLQELDRFSLD
ncbi:MAG: beta-propeller domain-containing protein [Candidatus Micrarchaeota archaeon]|nr:beta-propeller domain-containing protein [Candidatus Micrarchaeota archaeon]